MACPCAGADVLAMTPDAVGDTTGANRREGGDVVKVERSAHGIGPCGTA
jgi:hypothetical protein